MRQFRISSKYIMHAGVFVASTFNSKQDLLLLAK